MIKIRSNHLFLFLYILFIIYGSLFPLAGWRTSEQSLLEVWRQAMGGHISRSDLLTNLLVYIPFGFLVVSLCSGRFGGFGGVLLTVVLGALLSFSMEYLQLFLPARTSSPIDLLLNTLSSLLGGVAFSWLGGGSSLGERLGEWRQNRFIGGRVTDVGLVVIALWGCCPVGPVCPFTGCGRSEERSQAPLADAA